MFDDRGVAEGLYDWERGRWREIVYLGVAGRMGVRLGKR